MTRQSWLFALTGGAHVRAFALFGFCRLLECSCVAATFPTKVRLVR